MTELIADLPPGALYTFTALLLAHALADFTFQTGWMVRHKRNPLMLGLQILIVFAFSTAALGGVWQVGLMVALFHLIIDAVKVWALPPHLQQTLKAFVWDQIAHIATIGLAALWWPLAAVQGTWGPYLALAHAPAVLLSGTILTVWAGGFAVGQLTRRFQSRIEDDSLPEAGMLIGQLERSLILILVLIQQPAGIGFLIAAKSILRFDTAAQGQKAGEYVIIGTLASFAWALALSYATLALLRAGSALP
ncbi:DUF3307 domain-containing protein [Primorskyibacter sp. 2E107]|uniref:DUF3307 domain-containing protein n=1 Tax=Primorskyibacter sp. 2E107 TaxID=3403458 RepID=UPI003AF89A00